MPSLNNEALKANETERPGIYTFGHIIDVDIGLASDGNWTDLPTGGRVWRVKIVSPTAHALRFMFDAYKLPVGAKLFIYNPGKDTMGAFTAYNKSEDRRFATDVLKGATAIIEYYEPKFQKGKVLYIYIKLVTPTEILFHIAAKKQKTVQLINRYHNQ